MQQLDLLDDGECRDVAIIGMSCRFPGAHNCHEFWENLKAGKTSIQEIPLDRWDWKAFWGDPRNEENKSNSKWGGFIDDVDAFDVGFFGISPREAEAMDPQQRIMLQLAWTCLEDAGIKPSKLSGQRVGVYIGVFNFDYKELLEKENRIIETYSSIGTATAAIPNRISYYFNFKGPSLPIDTACSSSLNAIHTAVRSLNLGEASMALAGGVSLILTPTRHISFSKTGMLSPTGACKTFDDDADGYVRSEGAGLILLKPLKKAIEDGNRIYGVVKGSAVNHNGKTRTLTYPNYEAQAAVIADAIKSAGVSPETISYIEAHGTGTPKGDPLEFQGLNSGFLNSALTQPLKKNYCGLGSVKTNIGHLEASAGVAGVIKVLLSMKHRQLPGLQNFSKINHRIDIQNSAFYIVDKLKDWKPLKNEHKESIPRRAGVSSFGFGGTNAHVILEEYLAKSEEEKSIVSASIICLSAKTDTALLQMKKDLSNWLACTQCSLGKISAALLLGKEHFSVKAVFIVQSIDELKQKINQDIQQGQNSENALLRVNPNPEKTQDSQKLLEDLYQQYKFPDKLNDLKLKELLEQLKELYLQGVEIQWENLFPVKANTALNLPTYPFAKDRIWISPDSTLPINKAALNGNQRKLHPLLHQNISSFMEQKFRSTFVGKEPLLGFAMLEMARAAANASFRREFQGTDFICLKSIEWLSPVIINNEVVTIDISLYPTEENKLCYEITEIQDQSSGILSCGLVEFRDISSRTIIDLQGLKDQNWEHIYYSADCLQLLEMKGTAIYPGICQIDIVYWRQETIFSKLTVSVENAVSINQDVLLSILKTLVPLSFQNAVFEPKSIQDIEILDSWSKTQWVLLEIAAVKGEIYINILLCDEVGTVIFKIEGLVLPTQGVLNDTQLNSGLTELLPIWEKVDIDYQKEYSETNKTVLIIGGTKEDLMALQSSHSSVHQFLITETDSIETIAQKITQIPEIGLVLWVSPKLSEVKLDDDSLINQQKSGTIQVFRIIKALIVNKYDVRDLNFFFITFQAAAAVNERINPAFSSLQGLIGSLAKEYPYWKIRFLDFEYDQDWTAGKLLQVPPSPDGDLIVMRSGCSYLQKLLPVQMTSSSDAASSFKTGGVYIVIGGAGGIGEVLSEYLIRKFQAKVIWVGRRSLDESIQRKIDRLSSMGVIPWYISTDAKDKKSMDRLLKKVKAKYAQINGVIHSAIVLQDQSLMKMDETRFTEGLSAKVDISVRIAQVFQKEPLDFILFFSSILSFTKAAGQSNYSAGCTFKDWFAYYLTKEHSVSVKVINWGYWGSVGIVATKEYKEKMEKIGFGSIDPHEGMAAMELFMTVPNTQMVIMKSTKKRALSGIADNEVIKILPVNNNINQSSVSAGIPKQTAFIKRISTQELPYKDNIEKLLCKLLWSQLQSAGCFKETTTDLATIKNTLKLLDKYERWLYECIMALERHHYIVREGKDLKITDTAAVTVDSVWSEWEKAKQAWIKLPGLKAQVVLVESTLKSLLPIINGSIRSTDILFPNSSMELVEGFYKQNSIAQFFNEMLADAVVSYIKQQKNTGLAQDIRILEIGAGTGGTSATVFERLKEYTKSIGEYCYTDVSRAFLLYGEKEYGIQNPYLTYKIFDVGSPLLQQQIAEGFYDIVIATNVLHATKKIRETLRNAKALLKDKGVLLLNELTQNTVFLNLTFGFLEGWWLYDDKELRVPGSPLLNPDKWKSILELEGYNSIEFPGYHENGFGQQLIIASSNGIIRQLKSQPARSTSSVSLKKRNSSVQKSVVSTIPVRNTVVEDYVKSTVMKKIAESLKVDIKNIEINNPFSDYGVDSIIGVHLVQRINQELNINIETTSLFNYTTVNNLTQYIIAENKETLIKTLQINSVQHEDAPAAMSQSDTGQQNRNSLFKHSKAFHFQTGEGKGAQRSKTSGSVAIIGISARFAKSNDLEALWENLAKGVDLVGTVNRWELPEEEKAYCNYGSFLDEIDKFDSLFFNISGIEATFMDPQQRIFLEESWKALEDAGYTGDSISGTSCGVYVGCSTGDYQRLFGKKTPPQSFWGNLSAVIPARISYYMNLHGPAVAVDTACSSSLVATHLACKGLLNGDADMAIAGGIALQSTAHFYSLAGKAQMLSPTGKCYAFDDRADGFVPGEGVGVIVLKRLEDALNDGDHIYGVIKGSGVNQDGASNGITAPSAVSQERLERHVYDTFNIDPEKIQMVEAHGTGTKLGDPIEFNALTKTFRHYTSKKNYCAIGSIKTNIGHTTLAAGVAGIIKVLLALKYKKIPPSLHYQKGNSHINFEDSPFYVNTTLKDWEIEAGEIRRAVVSAFGVSGTNVHMVLEEAPERLRVLNRQEKPGYLIVITAKSFTQLSQLVVKMISFLKSEPEVNFGNVSFTLLLGRKHFDNRLSCIARNTDELITLLKSWVETHKTPSVLVSEINKNELREQPSIKQYGNNCIQECLNSSDSSEYFNKLSVLSELFIQGYQLDYDRLYPKGEYNRISLPTYPFDRVRFWVEDTREQEINQLSSSSTIHPCLQMNTSTFTEQRYSSIFFGNEFFLKDHVIQGQKVLPGVVYIEIARAAIVNAFEAELTDASGVKLKNIVWARPLIQYDKPMNVHISLIPGDSSEAAFEIYSKNETGEDVIHCQGLAALIQKEEPQNALDLNALRTKTWQKVISHSDCYNLFKIIGINYGPGLRGIENIFVGESEILAKLSLPDELKKGSEQYYLHPSTLDSAFQTILGLILNVNLNKAVVPFALDEIEIIHPNKHSQWVVLNYSEKGLHAKVDITICDDAGKVCVRIKGLTMREIEGEANHSLLLLESVMAQSPQSSKDQLYHKRIVFFCEPDAHHHNVKQTNDNTVRYLVLDESHVTPDITERYQSYALKIIEVLQEQLEEKLESRVLFQLVTYRDPIKKVFIGLQGILKSAHKENPKFNWQIFDFETKEAFPAIETVLADNGQSLSGIHIQVKNGIQWMEAYQEISLKKEPVSYPWKDKGVYFITGGLGGISRVFTQDIVNKVKGPVLILSGRSPLNSEGEDLIRQYTANGAQVRYFSMDVSKSDEVDRCVSQVSQEFGNINGIIHNAGVTQDSFILKKSHDELKAVFAPKVKGLVNLDLASKHLKLDWFIISSALAGVSGNVGQADYAAANAFMDAYAVLRNENVKNKNRFGKTVAIDWPFWKDGGMKVHSKDEASLLKQMGISAMSNETGLDALYKCLSLAVDQAIVLHGNTSELKNKWLKPVEEQKLKPAVQTVCQEITAESKDNLKMKAVNYFKKLLSATLKLPAGQLDAEAPFENYGIDSIMVMDMTNQLEKQFGSLSKTLFFEYRSIASITNYFIENYRDILSSLVLGGDKPTPKPAIPVVETPLAVSAPLALRNTQKQRFTAGVQTEQSKPKRFDVAIIGLSGRYPGANDLNAFWDNLKEGKDSITEIPEERWNYRQYFDEDKNKVGKIYSKWGGFISGVDEFDPLFFNISPREAEIMDPQERLFLECAYKTVEDAGYTHDSISKASANGLGGNVGVYVGVMYEEYQLYGAQEQIQGRMKSLGASPSSIANRVSYSLNFQGPSMAVDTMCSSSLTAIHLACQSMERDECEMALAGGVNVSIHPNKYLYLSQGKFVSSKGWCESFGKGGDGYVPGEGIGAVLLKPLSKAIEDGDHIYGVIKGSKLNSGGRTNGYTVPNPLAQSEVIKEAIDRAGVPARAISYIEAHGTGTSLGDPIEISGLTKAFECFTGDKQFCAIGSVKSNIGHCESAAGIAGLTKILLQMKHRKLVPSLHSEELNPNIAFIKTPFFVQQDLVEWKRPSFEVDGQLQEFPRIAGLSSFGAGGANAHILIEEYCDDGCDNSPVITEDHPAIIILSAKDTEKLVDRAKILSAAIVRENYSDNDLAGIAYTLQTGREAMEERLGFTAVSVHDLLDKLKRFADGEEGINDFYRGQKKRNKDTISLFTADEDLQIALTNWINKGKYERIIDLWVKGLDFDWRKLYECE